MKELVASVKLLLKKSGGRMPVVLLLLLIVFAFAVVNQRRNFNIIRDNSANTQVNSDAENIVALQGPQILAGTRGSCSKLGVNLLDQWSYLTEYQQITDMGMGYMLQTVTGNDPETIKGWINNFNGTTVVRFCYADSGSCAFDFHKAEIGTPRNAGIQAARTINAVSSDVSKSFIVSPVNEPNTEHWAGDTPAQIAEFYEGFLEELNDISKSKTQIGSPTFNVHAGDGSFDRYFNGFTAGKGVGGWESAGIEIWTMNAYNGHGGIVEGVDKLKAKLGNTSSRIGINEIGDKDKNYQRLNDSIRILLNDDQVEYALFFNAFGISDQFTEYIIDDWDTVLGSIDSCYPENGPKGIPVDPDEKADCNDIPEAIVQDPNAEYCRDNLIDGSFENIPFIDKPDPNASVRIQDGATYYWFQLNSGSAPFQCGDYLQEPLDGNPGTVCRGPEIKEITPLSASQCQEGWTSHGDKALKIFTAFGSINGGVCINLPASVTASGGKAGYDVKVKENHKAGPFGETAVFLGTSSLVYDSVNGSNWASVNWGAKEVISQQEFSESSTGFVDRFLNINIPAGAKSLCLRVNNEKAGIGIDSFWDGGYVTDASVTPDNQCKTAAQTSADDGVSRQGGGNCDDVCRRGLTKNPYDKEVLKIPDHWYANSCYLEDRGNNSFNHLSGVGGLESMIRLNPCDTGLNKNPNFTCAAGNYTAGYVHTATPRNVKLLNYFSAFDKTTDNNYLTRCNTVNTTFNYTTNEYGKFQIDWGKQFPGLARVFSSNGETGYLRVPGLGTASACGIVNPNDVLSRLVLHPYSQLTAYEQVEKAIGGLLSTIVNFFKSLFENKSILNNQDATGTINKGNECQIQSGAGGNDLAECGVNVSSLCPNLAGGPISHLNFSDKKKISTDHENGAKEERVLKEENLVFNKNDVCDRQFRESLSEGYVGGANCNLDNVPKGSFDWTGTFENVKVGIAASKSASARRLINVHLIPDYDPTGTFIIGYHEECDVCGQSVSCQPSQEQVYNMCRAAGGNVSAISGDPHFNIKRPGYENLDMIGLNRFLYNIWMEERLLGIKPVIHNDNVGINAKVGFSVYDMQKPIPGTTQGTSLGYQPSDYKPEESDHYLTNFMSYEEQPYLAPYTGGFSPAFIKDTGTSYPDYISRAQIAYYFPWLGEIPRMMERIAFFKTNPSAEKVRNALDNCNFKSLAEDPEFDARLMEIFRNVFIPCCNEVRSKGNENYNNNNNDCYSKNEVSNLTVDPLTKYLFTPKSMGGAGFDTNENQNTKKYAGGVQQCINPPIPNVSTTPSPVPSGGGNCNYDNVLELVSRPVANLNISNNDPAHVGTDLAAANGTSVYAAGAGEVVFVRNATIKDSRYYNKDTNQGECYSTGSCDWYHLAQIVDSYNGWWVQYGNVVGIKHKDGVTVYAHLNNASLRVQVGNCVNKGQQIAEVDNTGNSSGPHLHFEVRKLGCINYSQSCVVNNNTTGNIEGSFGGGTPGGDVIPPGEQPPYCENPDTPGPGNPGKPNVGGLSCLIKKAADSLNSSSSRIAPEILYAIMKQETSLVCPATWDSWRDGDRTACNGDSNQTAFASRNRVAWEGRINKGLCPVDIRGLTQFAAGPSGSGSCANTFNGITGSYTATMQACIEALGIDNTIDSSLWSDPLSSNTNYSRHRVGDAICAAAIKLSEDAKYRFGRYVTQEEWRSISGMGGQALEYVSSRYHGNCTLNYCANTNKYAKEAINSGLFTNLNCN